MGVQADRIFAAVAERGFPDPWATFGEHLSWEAAYAVQLKTTIDTARKNPNGNAADEALKLFDRKAANLKAASHLLADVTEEYDASGMWTVLNERAARLDIADMTERWAKGLVHHPFPIALRSLEFNWGYMKEHGVRAFYEMTTRYVTDLATNTARWQKAFEDERASGVIDRITTVEADLASEEALMHCDICKKTITALLYLDG
ncbi:hypothetical protein BTM25_04270 [Actinomadura rubteroloni]|uniref:Uncharacterized protein n=1 Tax=Actinomadura rubteroloni TaxID=1926885 RepID=A0A2P4ULW4_9ACTN|nr:hypothetical protein [Actinomadura rubteroloni]POM26043.1 hypothetical protein BTM25_04270 [Actinomadura rubteroloni]